MTMHLMSHAYSTINSRKRKPKMTKANIAKWTEECRQHNKLMKRIDSSRKTLEEYIDYIHGIAPKRNPLKDWKPMEVKTNYFQAFLYSLLDFYQTQGFGLIKYTFPFS